jgi:hypothetical protein
MSGAMDTVVFSVVFILVILAFFILAFVAVAKEERRQRRAEGDLYAPPQVAPAMPPPVPAATKVTAPTPIAEVRPVHFVPAP